MENSDLHRVAARAGLVNPFFTFEPGPPATPSENVASRACGASAFEHPRCQTADPTPATTASAPPPRNTPAPHPEGVGQYVPGLLRERAPPPPSRPDGNGNCPSLLTQDLFFIKFSDPQPVEDVTVEMLFEIPEHGFCLSPGHNQRS